MTDINDSAAQPGTLSSSAIVTTDRPGRYGKQLAAHLGRKLGSSWDDDNQNGSITFPFGTSQLSAHADGLHLRAEVGDDPDLQGAAGLDRLEDVVGRHLVRFGGRDELVVRWQRSDGSPGSQQVNEQDPEPAASK
jgi:uncharacterized protein